MNRAASEESSATGEFTSLPGDVSPGTASHSPLSFTRPGNSSQPSEPSEPTVHSRPSSAQVQPTPANVSAANVSAASAAATPIRSTDAVHDGSAATASMPGQEAFGLPDNLEKERTVISRRPAAVPAEFMRSLSLVELARTLEGRQLHHFAVDKMIGGGGMGAVFKGRDLRLDRDVAIKVIPESKRDSETLRRFRMEAQSAARLDHPNIARVYDIGEDETWNYIVFEFIEGINLRDLVQIEGPMSIDDAVFTTRQVAEALEHAHERGVVHRDIKPSNVIITPNGIAKVVDMGLARNTAMDRSSADQTASGVTLGTFDYISPEQARDPRDADVRSDLYSLGCTLFYMLTGQPPFPDGTALQKLLNHGSQPHPDPRQWRDDISDQLAAVLSKLMAKRPVDRYQKPLELINDLLMIAQLESLPRSRTAGAILLRPSVSQRTFLESHLPWMVPLCALLASAFWLQSADSLSAPLELPKPNLIPAGSVRPANEASEHGTPARGNLTNGSSTNGAGNPGFDRVRIEENDAGNRSSALTGDSMASRPSMDPVLSADTSANRQTLNAQSGLAGQAFDALPGNEPGLAPSVLSPDQDFQKTNKTPWSGTSAKAPLMSGAVSPTQPGVGSGTGSPALSSPGSTSTPNSNSPSTSLSPGGYATDSLPTSPTTLPVELVTPAAGSSRTTISRETVIVRSIDARTATPESQRVAPNLAAALSLAANNSEIRFIELHDASLELTEPVTVPRSGLTLKSGPGHVAEIILTGASTFGSGWETWIDVGHHSLRCEGLRVTCRNDMRQPQAIFQVGKAGRLELQDCTITMHSAMETVPGACILLKEPNANSSAATASSFMPMPMPTNSSPMPMPGSASAFDMPVSPTTSSGTNGTDSEPTQVVIRASVIRGYQNLINLRSVLRSEISIEKSCAMLEGRAVSVRGLETGKMPVAMRMSLDQSTIASQQGFAFLQAGSGRCLP